MQVVSEILAYVGHEIALEPVRFAIEVVQFIFLLVIIYFAAMGLGKRRGIVRGMLDGRRARISDQLSAVDHSVIALDEARETAARVLSDARAEAEAISARAREEARDLEDSARAEADAEAESIGRRAEEALATETEELHAEVRDRLIEVVASATRSVLNERLSAAEQRELIQDAIMAAVRRCEAGNEAPKRAVAGRGAV